MLDKNILSFKEAVAYLDVSESMLYKLTSSRVISFSKPNGGRIYFKKSDLDSWMLQNVFQSIDALECEVLNHSKKEVRK
ncbi:helix-turn-helix domain-containing protein [Dysgonomonas sp. GY617]|uniref:helix-turn-helix domain-containing protein n=1 Tax=Dysgonomonas sp. GY617 TaxID=2780420 RepID=UPI0018841629|nr:helix-turn-helix domain-containing protein [Dysgonomonas sp. GY617]MBF0576380.1 helix-turn-helix domain-containing protein [Dysgonomonas sp. GY617]